MPLLGHDRIQCEQAKVAQREEAGESDFQTSFLSNVNNTKGKIFVVVHSHGKP